MSSVQTLSIYKKLFFLLLAFFLVFLSWSTYRFLSVSSTTVSEFNVFKLSGIDQHKSLKKQEKLIQTNLDKLVWFSDRQKGAIQLLRIKQQRLTLQPYNGWLWHEVLDLQHQLRVPQEDIFWSLNQSLQWNRWYQKQQPSLSFYCLYYWYSVPNSISSQCIELIKQLKDYQDDKKISKLLGLEQAYIRQILEQGVWLEQ